MGCEQLREALRCLCTEIGWSYAVFWRAVESESTVHLVWEDGHVDDMMEVLVHKIMAQQVHLIGEGIVGKAAATGCHRWICVDKIHVNESCAKDLAELNHQFLAGIQTILVIPVLAGILQLGCTQVVMENIMLVNHVKHLFEQFECVTGVVLADMPQKALGESSQLFNGISVIIPDMSAFSHVSISKYQDQNSLLAFSELPMTMTSIQSFETTKRIGYTSDIAGALHIRPDSHKAFNGHHRSLLSITGEACKQENGLFETSDFPSNQTLFSTLPTTYQENQTCEINTKDNDDTKFPPVFTMPNTLGNELLDILGPDYKIDSFGGSVGDVILNKNATSPRELVANSSGCMARLDACHASRSVNDLISESEMFSEADVNQLLEAVVSNTNSGAKENIIEGVDCKTSVSNTCSSSIPILSPHYNLASSEQIHGLSSSFSPIPTIDDGCIQNVGIFKSQIGLLVEHSQSMHSESLSGACSKRIDEIGKSNKKRAKPGENPRPRPKDRQMIMDRVKELREIVPNGAKCSIDALLEKTIKHMLFLQSVTKYADNLKDIGEPKLLDKEEVLQKEKFQSVTCPVIVEDLKQPRQTLVEMLCDQHGFFLEIANLIRGLGLTILKGVMEAHKDRIWARFAVEANRDVTRMEIFLSLVRLLKSTMGCNTMLQGAESFNLCNQSCIM